MSQKPSNLELIEFLSLFADYGLTLYLEMSKRASLVMVNNDTRCFWLHLQDSLQIFSRKLVIAFDGV